MLKSSSLFFLAALSAVLNVADLIDEFDFFKYEDYRSSASIFDGLHSPSMTETEENSDNVGYFTSNSMGYNSENDTDSGFVTAGSSEDLAHAMGLQSKEDLSDSEIPEYPQ
uniref:Uncharacterized protein n=1 Tax=Clastoptera arizonana TaxID=38151 RepID=A0A1B6C8B5_9HEMI